MQRYFPLRVQTALYLSIFFLSLHHVFVYFTNASVMKERLGLGTFDILSIYGLSSLFGIGIYLALSRSTLNKSHTKVRIYVATIIELICLAVMYIATTTNLLTGSDVLYAYISIFIVHHIITPYILFNLDKLFEDYTYIQERGKGRGIYATMWNTPFVVVPLMLSTLSTETLTVTYLVAFCLLVPFLILITSYIQNPVDETEIHTPTTVAPNTVPLRIKIKNFWADKLDRNSLITQSTLHLYYGITGILLPIYLHDYFGFGWDHIGLLLAVSLTPFILIQIPFGKMEDRKHNEKQLFIWGIILALIFVVMAAFVPPSLPIHLSFLLLTTLLFISRLGCSMIEISSETMFYKHVTERDEFALLAVRAGRLVPYALGIIFLFF